MGSAELESSACCRPRTRWVERYTDVERTREVELTVGSGLFTREVGYMEVGLGESPSKQTRRARSPGDASALPPSQSSKQMKSAAPTFLRR